MTLLSVLSLLQLGVLSGVLAQVGDVQVWMNDSRLQYSGEGGNGGVGWGTPLSPGVYYNNRTCGTGVRATYNEGAQVSLQFNGSSLWIFFLADQYGGNATIYLDNNPVDPNIDTFNATTSYSLCNPVTFQTSNFTSGIHNVTVVKNSGPPALMYMHGFQFTPSDSIFPASKSSSNTGAIVGGIIGGIALLLLVAVAIVFFRRRSQRQPHVLDITEHTVEDASDAQSPAFARNTVPTPFTYQRLPQSERPKVDTPRASSSSSSPIPLLPMAASEKSRLPSPRPLPQSPSATSIIRANKLTAGRDMNSDQVDVIRTLVDQSIPDETISRVIETMVAGQPVPNTMEGYDLRQATPPIEPPPQYSAVPRRP